MIRLIGITGGIGAGKSVVSRILRLRGEIVYDCDYEARRLMDFSQEIKCGIREGLGEECVAPDGNLDRKRIAEIVFSEREKLETLNRLVHSAVREDVMEILRKKNEERCPRMFVESAILAGSRLAEICSEIWMVEADMELRFKRAIARGGIDSEDLRRRIHAQENEFSSLPPEKVKVIRNDGTLSLLGSLDLLMI